jgi:hypothetical protein
LTFFDNHRQQQTIFVSEQTDILCGREYAAVHGLAASRRVAGQRVPAMKAMTTPPCPKCRRFDLAEEEDQGGSSARWFICSRCGVRYTLTRRSV